MIIAVTGGREPTPQTCELAKALGYEVMGRGHDLLNGGAEGVDAAAVEGAKSYRQQEPAGRIIIYRPRSKEQPYARGYTEVSIKGADPAERRDAVARDADVLIILGGAKNTNDICQRARNYGKLILPVGITGGTALDVWHDLKADTVSRYAYRSALTEEDFKLLNPHDLKAVREVAGHLVGLAARIIEDHQRSALPIALRAYEKPLTQSRFFRVYDLETKRKELVGRYETLTKRIAGLETDIGREIESERRLVLEDRRSDLTTEREQVTTEIDQIEQKLVESGAVFTGSATRVLAQSAPPFAGHTPQERASLERQFAEQRENLRLIEESKSQYVLESDIPLQLIKNERRLRERIAEIEARLGSP